jgi:hypothetical protein
VTEINRQPDYDRLLNLKALSAWTLERQGEHGEDARAYEAALASFQAHLRSQHIDGDRRGAAARRARRVEKHLRSLVRASRRAEGEAEKLRTAYAAHVAHVAALPGQRQTKALAKADRKAGRRQAVGEMTAKSLHKTSAARVGGEADGSGDATTAAAAAPQPRSMEDLWKGRSA